MMVCGEIKAGLAYFQFGVVLCVGMVVLMRRVFLEWKWGWTLKEDDLSRGGDAQPAISEQFSKETASKGLPCDQIFDLRLRVSE